MWGCRSLALFSGYLALPTFPPLLHDELAAGCTFARARERAVERLAGPDTAQILQSPNNTLGVEYCKAIRTLSSSLRVFTMKRIGAAHDSLDMNVQAASASLIRSFLLLKTGAFCCPHANSGSDDFAN